jgi:hypothetical protein
MVGMIVSIERLLLERYVTCFVFCLCECVPFCLFLRAYFVIGFQAVEQACK